MARTSERCSLIYVSICSCNVSISSARLALADPGNNIADSEKHRRTIIYTITILLGYSEQSRITQEYLANLINVISSLSIDSNIPYHILRGTRSCVISTA